MSIIDKIHESEKKANDRAIATKILDKMKSLRLENDENSSKRWIWELLQNAKDCAFENQKVKVKINFDKEAKIVEFSHNAQPFTPENLTFLIKQVSTKERGDVRVRTTGKFGTGFLSTHLLSEIVDLDSVIYDEEIPHKKFKLTLDRSGRDIESVLNAIDKSFKQLSRIDEFDSLQNFNQSSFNTKFTYRLDDHGLSIAEQGLADFKACIFYVLIFINNICSVKLEHESREFVLSEEIFTLDKNVKKYIVIETTRNVSYKHEIIVASKDEISIAMPIVVDGEYIAFDNSKEKPAKLFCDFPLVGTEIFPFPAVINCRDFNPTEPRDGVYLTNKEDKEIFENKAIINVAKDLLYQLTDFASLNNWQRMFVLAQFPKAFEAKWIDSDWLKTELIDPLIEKLLWTPIVDTMDQQRKAIKADSNKSYNVWFPSSDKQEIRAMIWELYSKYIPSILPRKDEIDEWYNSLVKYASKLTVKEAFGDISYEKTIKQLSEKLEDDVDVFDWLNYFFTIVEESKEEDLFNEKFQVLPNQNGDFINKSALKKSINTEERIKDVAALLGVDVRRILLHSKIKNIDKLQFEELNQSEVVDSINNVLRSDSKIEKLEACELLLSLFPNDKEYVKNRNQLASYYSKMITSFVHIDKKTIQNWSKDIWAESDKFIVRQIAKNIANCESIDRVADILEINKNEALKWINSFVDYLVKNDFSMIDSKKTAFLPNQNGGFCTKESLFLDDGEIDEILKDISAELGYDFRDSLLDMAIFLEMPATCNVNEKRVAEKVIELSQTIMRSSRSEEEKKTFRKLIIWFSKNSDKAKKLFGEFYNNRHKLYEDKEIAASFQQWEETNELLEELGVSDINELRKIIEKSKSLSTTVSSKQDASNESEEKREITKEDLLQYGITTKEELEKAFEIKEFADKFIHRTTQSPEMFNYVQKLLQRAKENVKKYLLTLNNYYDCSEIELETAPTIIAGIKKKGIPITVVARPSDFGQVLFYYSSEKDALDYENAELWVEDGKSEPQLLTLGRILKSTGINRIPISRGR